MLPASIPDDEQRKTYMAFSTKIATCTYCGARAALVLDRGRHELSCDRCGAPLHDMKRLKADTGQREVEKPVLGHGMHKRPYREPQAEAPNTYRRRKRYKKRKSLMHRIMKEIIDVVDDIID